MHDFVIVGAGSAGCVLANRLSVDTRVRVLVLEAGPDGRRLSVRVPAAWRRLLRSDLDWAYVTEPQEHLRGRTVAWPRGKVLGGSSAINAQAYLRGHRSDYDGWAALGNDGWGYDDVLSYFTRSEHNERGPSRVHGQDGPLNVSDMRRPRAGTEAFFRAAEEIGLARNDDLNGPDPTGVGRLQFTRKRGLRCSTADAYIRPVLARPNLEVLTDAQAVGVVFEDGRATGVRYRRGGREHVARAGTEVILCGGAVNSPQLLLISGVGPAAALHVHGIEPVYDLPGVGRNLQDHMAVGISYDVPPERLPPSVETAAAALRLVLSRDGLLTFPGDDAAAFVHTRPDLPAPDLHLLFGAPQLVRTVPTRRSLAARTGPRRAKIAAVMIQPRSRGYLEVRSKDPLAPPLIDPCYVSDADGEDLRVLVEGVKLIRRLAATAPLASILDQERRVPGDLRDDEDVAGFVRSRASSFFHPVGTCKMGVDDMAVVDPELRVRGVTGLRVVDASVMPVIPRGHMNAPTIMIAEKAADLILDRSRHPATAKSGP